jgi:excisionase family DNA binding protein
MTETPRLLLSPKRVAERLDMGRTKISELISTGELESVRIGRSRRVPADAVSSYVERLRCGEATS